MPTAVQSPEEKTAISSKILYSLPEWFGLPESTAEYIETCRSLPFWAEYRDGSPIGFLAMQETSPYTAELYVMGVLKEYHRQGVGRALFAAFQEYAKSEGYEYLQVKTIDAGRYPEYDRTRLFYESLGFRKLETFPTLWDEWNPCLVLIQSV